MAQDIGFFLPELIIESIIRDGILNVKADPTIIDSVFNQLTRSYNSQKYSGEIDKIKDVILKKSIGVVYSYADVDANVPCFSIQVGEDSEDKNRAHLGDQYDDYIGPITNGAKLAALVRVTGIIPTSYDPTTGMVKVSDLVDLSLVYKGMVYEDGETNKFDILSGISNVVGSKFFFIQKDADINIVLAGKISSQFDYEGYEIHGVTGDEKIVIGVHTKDALLTKYLYILLKYFVLSRKKDIIKRGLYVSSFSGSDFSRDSRYLGDKVFTRFVTITGKLDDKWRTDQVVLIDHVEVTATPVE